MPKLERSFSYRWSCKQYHGCRFHLRARLQCPYLHALTVWLCRNRKGRNICLSSRKASHPFRLYHYWIAQFRYFHRVFLFRKSIAKLKILWFNIPYNVRCECLYARVCTCGYIQIAYAFHSPLAHVSTSIMPYGVTFYSLWAWTCSFYHCIYLTFYTCAYKVYF